MTRRPVTFDVLASSMGHLGASLERRFEGQAGHIRLHSQFRGLGDMPCNGRRSELYASGANGD